MSKKIAKIRYIYLFTSSKIALLKKLKTNILDYPGFFNRFYLLIINKIYLIH